MEMPDDGPPADSPNPLIIPEGADPARFMLSHARGGGYRSYSSLEEAKRDPTALFVLVADSGGQLLVTCPVRHVAASRECLLQLLADLEAITWGIGFCAQDTADDICDGEMYFEAEGFRPAVDGVWCDEELTGLGLTSQVTDVVTARSERLELPERFPFIPTRDIEAARVAREGTVTLRSGRRPVNLVRAPAFEVNIGWVELFMLAGYLDSLLHEPIRANAEPPKGLDVIIETHLRGWSQPKTVLVYGAFAELGLGEAVVEALRGERTPQLDPL